MKATMKMRTQRMIVKTGNQSFLCKSWIVRQFMQSKVLALRDGGSIQNNQTMKIPNRRRLWNTLNRRTQIRFRPCVYGQKLTGITTKTIKKTSRTNIQIQMWQCKIQIHSRLVVQRKISEFLGKPKHVCKAGARID